MQRYQAHGNPGEYGDWIVGVVDLPSMDEAGCLTALRDIVEATKDMEHFLSLPNREEAMHYTLRFEDSETAGVLMHERDFWPVAVRFPGLRPLIVQYVEQANAVAEGSRWQDEFHPSASFAIAELALADPSACGLLGSLFFKWDMGHETYHEGLIDKLIEVHGAGQPILDLLACRTLADGQANQPQIAAALYEHDLRDRIDLADFARRCAPWVARSVSADLGLDHFALIYADGDEAAYDEVWAAFHAAGITEAPGGFDADDSRRRTEYRSSRLEGHWNGAFLDPSVEDFVMQKLVRLEGE